MFWPIRAQLGACNISTSDFDFGLGGREPCTKPARSLHDAYTTPARRLHEGLYEYKLYKALHEALHEALLKALVEALVEALVKALVKALVEALQLIARTNFCTSAHLHVCTSARGSI